MDMVNDGKDIRLDTPQAVKEALASGKDLYNPETGDLIVSYLRDYEDPTVEVFSYTPDELLDEITRQGGDLENLELTAHDITADGDYSHHVATYHSTDELAESGIFGKGGLMDVSGEISLAETMSSLKSEKPVLETPLNTDNVREWYTSTFPGDELGMKLNPALTFDDALASVPTGNGFYDSIGAGDSVVRERIFEELCNRYGYTYDEVYDSWLNESPLPSPAISQQPEKIAVAAGYRFNLVDTRETSGIDLKGCGTVVTVDGHDYEIMKGATYEDSRKVDDLLDSNGDKPISDYRKQPQGMSRTDDVFIASLVHYDYLDRAFSRIKDELRYLPDTDELRMVVSAADSLSRHYIEMGSNPVTEEEALEFIENCSKYPSYVIPGLDMPWEEYGPFGKVANDGRALEIINTLKRSSLATSLDDHPQGVSLKQAAMEAREASAKLFDKNVGADSPTRRDER